MSLLRRAPWRRLALLTLVSIVTATLGTLMIGAGGAAGAGIQVLSTLDRLPAYYRSIGMLPQEASLPNGLWPAGLDVAGAWPLLMLLLLATMLKYAWVLPGLAIMRGRDRPFEPLPWLLAGGGLAGWLLMLLIDQYGVSQAYFLLTGTILWAVLGAWGLVVLIERSVAAIGRRATVRLATVGALTGIGVVLGSASMAESTARRVLPKPGALPPLDLPDAGAMAGAMAAGLAPVMLALGLSVGAIWLFTRGRRHQVAGYRAALAVGVLAASLVLNPWFSRPSPPRRSPCARSRRWRWTQRAGSRNGPVRTTSSQRTCTAATRGPAADVTPEPSGSAR